MKSDVLQELRDDWHSVALYRVVIGLRGREDPPIAKGLNYTEATALADSENARLIREHPTMTCWTRPMASIQLENGDEAFPLYRAIRDARTPG